MTDQARRLKRLQIQSFRSSPSLVIGLSSKLVQKRARAATDEAQNFQNELDHARELFRAKFAPRAAVGIRMSFHVDQGEAPKLERLLKFYLDLTQGTLVADDRQIQYLEACRYPAKTHGRASGKVYLTFERLSRLNAKFDLATEFEDLAEDDPAPRFELDHPIGITRSDQWAALDQMPLSLLERPLSGSKRHDLARKYASFFRPPLSIVLPGLSEYGDRQSLRSTAEKSYLGLGRQYPLFSSIETPIDLDIQVWTSSDLERDLDNILGSLLPPFRQVLLSDESAIWGVRIYANRCTSESPPPSVRMRILQMGAIELWNSKIDEILLGADEHLRG